jgi:15-cis-phytoene synthase
MDALYAFLRISDDLADEAGSISEKKARLNSWRGGFLAALDGIFNHPILPALIQAIRQYNIPPDLLLATLDGVESDIEPVSFATFADLYPYCYRVASAVGLACVWIWGLRKSITQEEARRANEAAEAAGIAFQLTNILRDLKEDLARGRVYLPVDELARFRVSVEDWRSSSPGGKVQDLIRFQVARANDYYRLAEPLNHYLSSDGRAIYQVMMGTYRCLLDEIERSDLRLFQQRIRVPRWRKGLILLSGWAVKCGLL